MKIPYKRDKNPPKMDFAEFMKSQETSEPIKEERKVVKSSSELVKDTNLLVRHDIYERPLPSNDVFTAFPSRK